MATAILQIIAAILGYAAGKGLDALLGKWFAIMTAAFDKVATDRAVQNYNDTMAKLATNMPQKYQSWQDWKARMLEQGPPK